MHRTNAGPKPVLIGYARGRAVIAPGVSIAGVQLGHPFAAEKKGMRADEAGMPADVDQRSLGPQHPRDLADLHGKVIDVGVRPDGNGRVEGAIGKGELFS